jgi:2'-5' RNA ligase
MCSAPVGDGDADRLTLAMSAVPADGPAEREDLMVEGRTALIIPVHGLGPKVDQWRTRADPVAPGVPAHITVLVPFLPLARVDESVMAWLSDSFAGVALDREVVFDEVRAFPSVVWLHPEESEPFVRLTEAVHRRWPECPPYEGLHEEVIPHLTVAHGSDLANLVKLDLAEALPLTGQIQDVRLFAWTEGRWSDRASFPFGP